MPFSYAQYAGNGSTTTFSVPFPYLLKAHVKVYLGFNILDGTFSSELADGVGFNWTSGTQIQAVTAPASGQTLTVIRQTPNATRLVDWQDGSNLISSDLDTADIQNLYVVQEQQDRNDAVAAQQAAATQASNSALAASTAATATANSASATANGLAASIATANTNASNAVTTANSASATANGLAASIATANTNASNAVTTANSASATANGLAASIATANTNASNAVTTANSASATANGLAASIATANTNASNAVTTANAALPRSGGTMTGDITFNGTQTFPASGIQDGTTTQKGLVQLTNSTSSTSTTTAATPNSVKTANDTANAAMPKSGGTFTGDIIVPSINGGPLAGTRNRIINGDMRISQRGTTFATLDPASGTYTLDRWQFAGGSAGRVTIAQSSAVPNNTFSSSLYGDVVTADTSIAASDVVFIQQTIEGFNARDLIGTTFTISFWVYSTKTGVFCVALRNSGADRSYVAEYTVSASNTWEYKTITVSGGLITSGTWDWTNGIGFRLAFALACGTTFQTTSGAWQTGNFIGTSNQVNALDSTANDFYITGVQLEPGSVATPFERRSYGQELALCERYYEKSYNLAAVPGTNVGPNTGEWVSVAVNAADYNDFGRCSFRTRKRASPTMSIWSTDGTANTARQQDASNVSVVVRTTFNETSGSFGCGSATAGYYHRIHFAASAEL